MYISKMFLFSLYLKNIVLTKLTLYVLDHNYIIVGIINLFVAFVPGNRYKTNYQFGI